MITASYGPLEQNMKGSVPSFPLGMPTTKERGGQLSSFPKGSSKTGSSGCGKQIKKTLKEPGGVEDMAQSPGRALSPVGDMQEEANQ